MAKESPKPGYLLLSEEIPITVEDIADEACVDEEEVRDALVKFQEQNMIHEEDGVWVITNWHKRQFSSDSSTERVKRFRQKKCNVSETFQKRFSNADVTPPDTETDTEKNNNKESVYPPSPQESPLPPKEFSEQPKEKNFSASAAEPLEAGLEHLLSRYSQEQQAVIINYWDTIRFTRKSARIAPSVKVREMQYWERYPPDLVIEALNIHLARYPTKGEDYTRGIIRRLAKERQLAERRTEQDGKHRQLAGKNSGAVVDISQFVWKGT